MAGVLLGIHILISFALILVVLLQSGKGGGLAGAFGGAGGVGAVFGGQTAADFLTKATRYLAIGFFLTSLVLAIVSRERILGTVEGSLERRGATPATEAGEMLPPDEMPEGLPGAEEGAVPGAPESQIPVMPEGGTPGSPQGEAAEAPEAGSSGAPVEGSPGPAGDAGSSGEQTEAQ